MQACSPKHKSVEGVAFRKKSGDHGSSLASAHGSVASSTSVGNGLGASDGRGGGQQLVKLSLGKGIRQDEGPVLHATSAEKNRGQNFVNCTGKLPAAHVDGGTVNAGNGHRIGTWL